MKNRGKAYSILLVLAIFFVSCTATNSVVGPEIADSEEYKLYTTKDMTVKELCGLSDEFYENLLFGSEKDFGYGIYEIKVTLNYYKKWNSKKEQWYSSEIFLREIALEKHELGEGKPGSDEYIIFKTKKISIPFFTSEEKRLAAKLIADEYETRLQQVKRIAENRKLNPKNLDYQDLPVLNMMRMGVSYAPNPPLVVGNAYIADNFRFFYVINRMQNGDYNIGQDYGSYGRYQFILRNTSGESMEGIGGHMFADTAYLRYLGKTETITSDGFIQYLPYFEMLKKNPHESAVIKILNECKTWKNISEDALDL